MKVETFIWNDLQWTADRLDIPVTAIIMMENEQFVAAVAINYMSSNEPINQTTNRWYSASTVNEREY